VLDGYRLIEALEEVREQRVGASAVIRARGMPAIFGAGVARSQRICRASTSIGFSSTPHGTAEDLTEHFHHLPPVDNLDNNGCGRSDSRKANRRPSEGRILMVRNWGMQSGRVGSADYQAKPDQVGMARL
jgi:hypothetical protein